MFKLSRRGRAVTAGSDLPFCPMCQQAIRIDAATGRCALGHRAAAPTAPVLAASAPVLADAVDTTGDFTQTLPLEKLDQVDEYEDPYSSIVYGRSEYDYSSESFDEPVTWDSATPAEADTVAGALDDFVTWDQPAELSALDVDPDQLPVAQDAPVAPPTTELPAADLLDELDDATYARRRAVGTVGASIAMTGAVFAAIAALPL